MRITLTSLALASIILIPAPSSASPSPSVQVDQKVPSITRSDLNISVLHPLPHPNLLIQTLQDITYVDLSWEERVQGGKLNHKVNGFDQVAGDLQTRETLRLKRLDTMSAVQLINSSCPLVRIGYSDGVPVLTLSPLAPGKAYKKSGSYIIRGLAGGGARLELLTSTQLDLGHDLQATRRGAAQYANSRLGA
ncbi:MAG: hypothetical protein ACJAZN_002879 [Planctomycetota bacterium]|jgi:hypothetical protein